VGAVTREELLARHPAPLVRCPADLDPMERIGTATGEWGEIVHLRVSRWPEPGWVAACGVRLAAFVVCVPDLAARGSALCHRCWPDVTPAGMVPAGEEEK
jgi:hypothetical protein